MNIWIVYFVCGTLYDGSSYPREDEHIIDRCFSNKDKALEYLKNRNAELVKLRADNTISKMDGLIKIGEYSIVVNDKAYKIYASDDNAGFYIEGSYKLEE